MNRRNFLESLSAVAAAFALPWKGEAKPKDRGTTTVKIEPVDISCEYELGQPVELKRRDPTLPMTVPFRKGGGFQMIDAKQFRYIRTVSPWLDRSKGFLQGSNDRRTWTALKEV